MLILLLLNQLINTFDQWLNALQPKRKKKTKSNGRQLTTKTIESIHTQTQKPLKFKV